MKLVYIEWLDHCSFTDNDWKDIDEFDDVKPQLIKTVGWILKEDDKMIIVVSTKHEKEFDGFDDKYTGDMCIIKGCIQKMKVLKV